ncbi:hypothetical protein E5288_WYG012054 [Bos mutus]|uniref:Uncharacterized protein n=1 Tax=Bos mutus TaxID=72004 RepID=A0A6B0R9F2_9CETA|nr:hypothetical protein [Bos mutus]
MKLTPKTQDLQGYFNFMINDAKAWIDHRLKLSEREENQPERFELQIRQNHKQQCPGRTDLQRKRDVFSPLQEW